MAIIDTGNSVTGKANVNTNFQLEVHTPTTESQAGFVQISTEVDSGTVTGSRLVRAVKASGAYRLRVGKDAPLLFDQFPGATLNSAIWTAPVTTMTVTLVGGFAQLNAGLSVASAAVARLQTYRSFPIAPTFPLWMETNILLTQVAQTNNVLEWGFGIATGTAAPTDGCFFRVDAAGNFKAIVNYNGTESTSATLTLSSLIGTVTKKCAVGIYADRAEFWIADILVAAITLPAAQAAITSSNNLPVLFRNYNSAAVSTAQVLKIGATVVYMGDADGNRPWQIAMAGMGNMGYQGPTGGTVGLTANYANSTNPGAAVPTNTTAALGSGLGGQFWETDTLAVTTDGIISSYQVPLGTSTLPGRSLVVYGVKIDSYISTVIVGGGYNAQWCLAFGHTAVSLATAEASTTKAPRRIALGSNTVAVAAAALTQLTTIQMTFAAPIVIQAGEFIQTVRKKVGTTSTSGVVSHTVTFDAHWE